MPQSRTVKVLALSMGSSLTMVVSLISGMVMARMLTKEGLGTYRQTMLAYNFAAPILGLGLQSAIYYFLPSETKRIRGVVVDGLIIMLIMGGVYALFISIGGNHLLAKRFSNPEIVHTLLYLIPYPLIMLPVGLLGAVLVVCERVTQLSIYNVISHLLLVMGIISACLLWKTPQSMILARVGISLMTGGVAIILMLRATPSDDWHPCWDNMKSMVKFSIPLAAAGMLGAISLQIDQIIVSSICTTEEFAVYSNGAFEIPMIGIITSSINSIILVEMRRHIAIGEKEHARQLFVRAAEKSAIFLLPIMCFLLVTAKEFIIVLFSEKYSSAAPIFRIYLLRLPLRIMVSGSALMCFGMSGFILKKTFVSCILNVILTILLVRYIGVIGAPIGTLIVGSGIAYFWILPKLAHEFNKRIWHIYPFITVFRILVPSTIAAVIVWWCKHLVLNQIGAFEIFCYSACIFVACFLITGSIFCRVELLGLYNQLLPIWINMIKIFKKVK